MAISDKAAAQNILDNMPDDASLDDLMYAMYVRKKIERGLRDIEAGNTVSHTDMKRDIAAWRESIGPMQQVANSGTSSGTSPNSRPATP